MNCITEYFMSGRSFFSGNMLLVFAVFLSFNYKKKLFKYFVWAFMVLGLVLILSSSVSVSPLYFGILGLSVFSLHLSLQIGADSSMKIFTNIARMLILVCSLYPMYFEYVNYWKKPVLSPGKIEKIYVFGGSFSTDEKFKPWPSLLKEKYGIDTFNFSVRNLNINSFEKESEFVHSRDVIIILDLMSESILTCPPAEFKKELEKLLKKLCAGGRAVLMFELPIRPFLNNNISEQRFLARKYGIRLIPKKYCARILCCNGSGNTKFGLSSEGHEKVAGLIWSIVRPCFESETKAKPEN